jgi:hypothetical protein
MRAGCFLRRLKYDMCFIFDYCPIGHCANLSHDIEGSLRFERSLHVTVGMIGYLPKVVSPVLSYSWIILSFGDYSTQHWYGVASIRLSESGGSARPRSIRRKANASTGKTEDRRRAARAHSVDTDASSASGIGLPVPSKGGAPMCSIHVGIALASRQSGRPPARSAAGLH